MDRDHFSRRGASGSPGARIFIAAVSTCLATAAIAGTATFDWEIPEFNCYSVWEQNGLRVTNARGTICLDGVGGGGSNSVSSGSIFSNDVEGLKFEHVQGKTFTPVTMEVGEYSRSTSIATPVTFIGTKTGGAQVSFNVVLDGVRDGPGGDPDFQVVTFPAEFQDLVRLEVPTRLWSCDNLVFSSVIPFPLPADQKLAGTFREGQTLYTKLAIDEIFVVGDDFHYQAGFDHPVRTQFMTETDSSNRSTPMVSFDPVARDLYYVSSSTIRRYREGQAADLITLQQVVDAGYGVSALSRPHGSGGQVYFMGTGSHGNDFYIIFKLEDGELVPVVTPETLLPGSSGPATPYWFPSSMAVRGGDFAFDTSLVGSSGVQRLFLRRGDGPFQQVLAEGETSPLGVIWSIDDLEFVAGGELEIRINRQYGGGLLVCGADGTITAPASQVIRPVNAGKAVSGEAFRGPDGTLFFLGGDELYRKHGDDYFRVIGAGDLIGGEPVTYLRFLAARTSLPRRIIVEVRLASASSTDRHVELLLDDVPAELPPRIGQLRVHPESGELYLPLSHLTMGREYWLRRSSNLSTWEDLWRIPAVEPLQHVVVPPELLGQRVFFRVEERTPAAGP